MLVMVGSYGWLNLGQVATVERRESGAMVVWMLDGSEIALLPEEAEEFERQLAIHQRMLTTKFDRSVKYETR